MASGFLKLTFVLGDDVESVSPFEELVEGDAVLLVAEIVAVVKVNVIVDDLKCFVKDIMLCFHLTKYVINEFFFLNIFEY